MSLELLTDKELESAIYEAIHKKHDKKYLIKLLKERKRRKQG